MKRIVLTLLIIAILTTASLGFNKQSHKLSLQFKIIGDIERFMKMSEITLKKTGQEPGRLAGLIHRTNRALKWNVYQSVYNNSKVFSISHRAKVLEKGLSDKEFDRLIKRLERELPSDWDTWKEARDKFVKFYVAGLRDIDVPIEMKDAEDYIDNAMLYNLDRFRDSEGKLHMPDFLLNKYKEKYPKEGK